MQGRPKKNNKKKKKKKQTNTGSVGLAETQVFYCLPYTVCKVSNKREAIGIASLFRVL